MSAKFKYIAPEDAARTLDCYNDKYIIRKDKIDKFRMFVQSTPFIVVEMNKTQNFLDETCTIGFRQTET